VFKKVLSLLLIVVFVFSAAAVAGAQGGRPSIDRPVSAAIADLKLPSPMQSTAPTPVSKIDRKLLAAQGLQQVVVRLQAAPVAEVAAMGADATLQQNQLNSIQAQQGGFIARARAIDPNATVLGTAQKALNAVMLRVDAASLRALAADPDVVSIKPVVNYQRALEETVPYIGARAVQELGFRGAGVRIAILDTGIDYTHAHLGGPGTAEAYADAYGTSLDDPRNTTLDGLFPTEKVIGGYDFVGEAWNGQPDSPPLAPDPDPIDCGPTVIEGCASASHGTHVADIAGGLGGVAPDAALYAVKVCSSVSSSCSGVALIQGMDFALDPNGDGRVNDHVDVINMSLGADYGDPFFDDLSLAVDNATKIGVLTVAAAGNGSDKPYVTGTPAAATTALSVAQTQVPSARLQLMRILAPADIAGDYPAVFQPWSAPLTTAISAPVQYGDGAGGNLNGCAPFDPGSLSGKIVLVDRGVCFFSDKIRNIADGGGLIGIIGLIAPGEPFEGGFGGGPPITIPGYMISQANANLIKGSLDAGVTALFDPANFIPLVMHMVGSSSRGPSMGANLAKPEIGAPGASVSAEAGTGDGAIPFGGTSGATPMVAGSAALLLDAFPKRSPLEIKALLMNTAETDIQNTPQALGGDLAAITRIGGGEVRVDRALASPAAAWDARTHSGALSFGFVDVTAQQIELRRTVVVKNYSDSRLTYKISPIFRFDDDSDNGAVEISAPDRITVGRGETERFVVTLQIDGTKLREWMLNSGSRGGNPSVLTTLEYDGYLLLDDTSTNKDNDDPLHLAWHVLPRLAADVHASSKTVRIDEEAFGFPAGSTRLRNRGVGTAHVDAYSLIGTSPNLPRDRRGQNAATIDLRYVGVATFPVTKDSGICSDPTDPAAQDSFVMAFAVNTWERQTHANAPGLFEFDLDTNQDGEFDFAVFNFDAALNLTDGRNVTWVQNLQTGDASAFFFTDHGTNSGNTVLLFCGEQIGMDADNFFQPIDMQALAVDFYFSGAVTDALTDITISPLGERYLGVFGADSFGSGDIPSGETERLTVLDFGPDGTNPTETGLLLLLDAARAGGVRGGAPEDNEAIAITVRR
jgi:subtilisin family serine protease